MVSTCMRQPSRGSSSSGSHSYTSSSTSQSSKLASASSSISEMTQNAADNQPPSNWSSSRSSRSTSLAPPNAGNIASAAATHQRVLTSSASSSSRKYSNGTSSSSSTSTTTSSTSLTENSSTSKILSNYARSMQFQSGPPNASMIYEPLRSFTPYISLGPVIGMVTETVGRVLFETSAEAEIKCFATDSYGVQHGVSVQCPANRPIVVQFDELRPGTQYRVTFDIPVPGLVRAGFRTLPSNWGSPEFPPQIAIVSTNDYIHTRDQVPHKSDLWKNIFNKSKRGDLDYCLHLGNIACIDNRNYEYRRDWKVGIEYRAYQGKMRSDDSNAYQEALKYVFEARGNSTEVDDHICNLFRNVFRDTWTQPCVRHALANIPNLAILGDLDIGDYVDDDDAPEQHYVRECAYRVYNEYCRSLFESFTPSAGSSVRIGQAYHFHAFGTIGFLFLDTHARKWAHRGNRREDETPFLGVRQWGDIEFALSPNGYLAECKMLFVCSADPVAQIGEAGFLSGNTSERVRLLTSWNHPAAVSEASLLLSKLFDWKMKADRNVAWLCGGEADGGVTTITDNRYEQPFNKMQQISAGPISGNGVNAPAALSKATCNRGIGVFHTFGHNSIVPGRNYAVVGVYMTSDSIELEASHVRACGKCIKTEEHVL